MILDESAGTDPGFAVVSGQQVHAVLENREREIIDLVGDTYLAHGAGRTVNPPSYFLRFPDRPDSRIIALPASLAGGERAVDGLKWISSFPGNVADGLPRASGLITLNDPRTGYPFACLEASIVSATRTAASAALAARVLAAGRPRRLGVVGTGLIARYIHRFLAADGHVFDEIGLHDLSAEHATAFRDQYLRHAEPEAEVTVYATVDDLVAASDVVVFATVAATPHVLDPGPFAHAPLVLHVSLRDLAPEVVLSGVNIVDDVEHCLKANTSVHLAEQREGNRDFVHATLDEVLRGEYLVESGKPILFSPFGLGVLDLAVAGLVYTTVAEQGELHEIPGFFHERQRYGTTPSGR